VADLRERGTSFLTELSNFAAKDRAIGLVIGTTTGLAFGTIVSPIAGDMMRSSEPINGVVDFFQLFVLRNPDTLAAVSSLTAIWEAGISTPEFGVIIAAVMFTIAVFLFPGREGDQLQ
jgi:large-conductance mechanosensitive channel